MNKALEAKLKTLPATPGVYFHKSESGEIIYVGKAAVLKNRVRQYFQSKKDFDIKTLALVNEISAVVSNKRERKNRRIGFWSIVNIGRCLLSERRQVRRDM